MTRPKPETPYQAEEWDKAKSRYLRAGLCHKCAAQAAWGHQQGFAAVKPPCDGCRGTPLPFGVTKRHGTRGAKWLGSPDVTVDEVAA